MMARLSPIIVFTLLHFVSLVATQVIQGATECADARGFTLCNNFLAARSAGDWQISIPLRSTSTSIAWSTEYDWSPSPNSSTPKSFANVDSKATKGVPLKLHPILTAAWSWEYRTKSDLLEAIVGLDMWIGSTEKRNATSATTNYDIKIWLASTGGVNPPGMKTAEALCMLGHAWNVWRSTKGNTETITFTSVDGAGDIEQLDGELGEFLDYLSAVFKVPEAYYIQSVQAGTVVYSGAAHFHTSMYTMWVEYPED